MFSYEFFEIFKSTYFVEHLWTAASVAFFLSKDIGLEPTWGFPKVSQKTYLVYGIPFRSWNFQSRTHEEVL